MNCKECGRNRSWSAWNYCIYISRRRTKKMYQRMQPEVQGRDLKLQPPDHGFPPDQCWTFQKYIQNSLIKNYEFSKRSIRNERYIVEKCAPSNCYVTLSNTNTCTNKKTWEAERAFIIFVYDASKYRIRHVSLSTIFCLYTIFKWKQKCRVFFTPSKVLKIGCFACQSSITGHVQRKYCYKRCSVVRGVQLVQSDSNIPILH
jgi:hypothetical protein